MSRCVKCGSSVQHSRWANSESLGWMIKSQPFKADLDALHIPSPRGGSSLNHLTRCSLTTLVSGTLAPAPCSWPPWARGWSGLADGRRSTVGGTKDLEEGSGVWGKKQEKHQKTTNLKTCFLVFLLFLSSVLIVVFSYVLLCL